jgi:hypothetical protein
MGGISESDLARPSETEPWKPPISISEKDRIDGFPVPNGWAKDHKSDRWMAPAGPWW